MGTIVLLESSDIGARYSADAVRSLGHEPFFLCDLERYQADPGLQIKSYPHFSCQTQEAEQVLQTLEALRISDIVAVTSFSDLRLSVATRVAQSLGVCGLDPAVPLLKSKAELAKLSPETSPPSILFKPDQIPTEIIRAWIDQFGRVILKPAEGAGAVGVFTVDHETDLTGLAETIARKNVLAPFVGEGWIAQAFVVGTLFSLEGYVLQAKPRFLGFTDRKKVFATESAACFPADHCLTENQRNTAYEAVSALVSRSGFKNGYFHVEFIVSEDHCYLVDGNMGRLGGGPIGELLALSYDVDPIKVYQHVLEVSLFKTESENPYIHGRKDTSAYSILYGLKGGGQLISVEIPRHTSVRHTQIIDNGSKVTPMGTDDWSWIGILTGLMTETEQVAKDIRIKTSEGLFPADY